MATEKIKHMYYQKGFSVEHISRITNLPENKINELLNINKEKED